MEEDSILRREYPRASENVPILFLLHTPQNTTALALKQTLSQPRFSLWYHAGWKSAISSRSVAACRAAATPKLGTDLLCCSRATRTRTRAYSAIPGASVVGAVGDGAAVMAGMAGAGGACVCARAYDPRQSRLGRERMRAIAAVQSQFNSRAASWPRGPRQ